MNDKEKENYTEANRLSWNEAMSRHQKANGAKWDNAFSTPGFVALPLREQELLKSIGVSGKKIAHLCCNNGIELMSLKNMGADRCVGFDISDEAIKEACDRSAKAEIPCEFERTDVYKISKDHHGVFDIVYISIGCFGWMPDLKQFFEKVELLLNEEGTLFIHELHPFAEMLPSDDNEAADPLKIIEPYFKAEPYQDNSGIDYVGKTTYESRIQYWFVWTLSDIIMGIIENDMVIVHFREYAEDISALHEKNQAAGIKIPLSYTMISRKKGYNKTTQTDAGKPRD